MEVAEPDMNLAGDGSSQEMARMPGSLRWSLLGTFWEFMGAFWEPSGSVLEASRSLWQPSGSVLEAFCEVSGSLLGASWKQTTDS